MRITNEFHRRGATPRRILRTPEAAAYLGLSPSTLEKRRLIGGGPRFIHLGGRAVGYDVRDLDAWLDGPCGADTGTPRQPVGGHRLQDKRGKRS